MQPADNFSWPDWQPALGVPADVWAAVGEAARLGLSAGVRAVATFDADGTLWSGDVGERHLRVAEREGLVSSSAPHDTLFAAYLERCAEDTSAGYAWAASVFAGLPVQRVRASAALTWSEHRHLELAPVWSIVSALEGAGVEVWIVSASNRWVIEAAGAEHGIGPERVIAMTVQCDDGVVGPEVEHPRPNGPGKQTAIEATIGVTPCVAFGNSRHDAAMLRGARLGVLVHAAADGDPEPALADLASSEGWCQLAVP